MIDVWVDHPISVQENRPPLHLASIATSFAGWQRLEQFGVARVPRCRVPGIHLRVRSCLKFIDSFLRTPLLRIFLVLCEPSASCAYSCRMRRRGFSRGDHAGRSSRTNMIVLLLTFDVRQPLVARDDVENNLAPLELKPEAQFPQSGAPHGIPQAPFL